MDDYDGYPIREAGMDPALLRRIMESPDGQTLLQMLNRQGDLQRAARAAAKGDTAEMSQKLRRLAQSPDGAALIARIQRATRT